jgi:hypothetical protein
MKRGGLMQKLIQIWNFIDGMKTVLGCLITVGVPYLVSIGMVSGGQGAKIAQGIGFAIGIIGLIHKVVKASQDAKDTVPINPIGEIK